MDNKRTTSVRQEIVHREAAIKDTDGSEWSKIPPSKQYHKPEVKTQMIREGKKIPYNIKLQKN